MLKTGISDPVVPQIHLNTMMSCALETYHKKDGKFLGIAIEHLNQYDLTPKHKQKIETILKNIASGSFDQICNPALPPCLMKEHPIVPLPSESWFQIYHFLDFKSCQALSVTDLLFHQSFQNYAEKFFGNALEDDGIVNTGVNAQTHMRFIHKLKVIKYAQKPSLHFSCLIMRKGLNWTLLQMNAAVKGIHLRKINPYERAISPVLKEWRSKYDVIFIKNTIHSSRDNSGRTTVYSTYKCLKENALKLPTLFELTAFFVFAEVSSEFRIKRLLTSTTIDNRDLVLYFKDKKTLKIHTNPIITIGSVYIHKFEIIGIPN